MASALSSEFENISAYWKYASKTKMSGDSPKESEESEESDESEDELDELEDDERPTVTRMLSNEKDSESGLKNISYNPLPACVIVDSDADMVACAGVSNETKPS